MRLQRFPLLALAGLLLCGGPAAAQTSVTVDVDAARDRRPISPLIYGVAWASTAQLADLRVPLNRWGGNTTSRYNWQVNADNRGSDWYFQSIASGSAVAGEAADSFITQTRAAGAQPMLTIPMLDWAAKVGPGRSKLCSFSIAKYGPQQGNDWQWFPDAGNGVRPDGTRVTGNDPADANVPVTSAYQQGWIQHLTTRWGTAANGGLRYYVLDNEPAIWHETHRDVHPVGTTMDELLARTREYASRIKAVDPGALVVGPEEFGWSGFLLSGFDLQYGAEHGWSFLPDRAAHGNWDVMPWLLDQLRQQHEATGQRLLDVFTLHWYPQSGEFGNDVSPGMQALRNRSTRSLWDPQYVDQSWIAAVVKLIPLMRQWVNTYYPGTRIGITEYNWGAEGHMNGATAQADVLGIFGREGLDLAARWTTPDASTPTYKAMKLYRNYDGLGGRFGDTSVQARVPNPDTLSAFAARRSTDGALTVMVVNKASSGSTNLTLRLRHFAGAATAQVWQLNSSNTIQRLADRPKVGSTITATVPGPSVTLFVLRRGPAPPR
jgi:hypothetical protein